MKTKLHDQDVKIVKACSRLPLSLEVIGQYLRRLNKIPKTIEERIKKWDDTLRKMKGAESFEGTIVTNEKFWQKLRISFDELLEGEKKIVFGLCLYTMAKSN